MTSRSDEQRYLKAILCKRLSVGSDAYGNHLKFSTAEMSSAFYVIAGSSHVLLQASPHMLF